jgi:putative flippase GtrA
MNTFLRFLIVGLLTTILHNSIFLYCVELLKLEALSAVVPSFFISLLLSYVLNYKWTFNIFISHKVCFPKYITVAVNGFTLNIMITHVIVELLNYWYGWALVIVNIAVPVTNYFLNRYWSFNISGHTPSQGE